MSEPSRFQSLEKSATKANKLPTKSLKPSIPSRQPHIGAQSTMTRINKFGSKNKKLYDYCMYAMKEVEKARSTKDASRKQNAKLLRTTVGGIIAVRHPIHCQNKLEKLPAKLLPDEDCSIEIEETEVKEKPSARGTRNSKIHATTSVRALKKIVTTAASKCKKGDGVKIKKKGGEERRLSMDTKGFVSPKLSQRTKLGICVEDNKESNNSFNINMNLTMNSVEKNRAHLLSQSHSNPYYVPPASTIPPTQYWSQNPPPVLPPPPYGVPYLYPLMLYNTQPCIIPIPTYNTLQPPPVKPTNEVSTNTECVASDISNAPFSPADVSKDQSPKALTQNNSVFAEPPAKIELKDLSIVVDTQSALVTPKNIGPIFAPTPKQQIKEEVISRSPTEVVLSAKEDPYMKRLYREHAPRRTGMLGDVMNKTVEVQGISKLEETITAQADMTQSNLIDLGQTGSTTSVRYQPPKLAVSFDIQEDPGKDSNGTLADFFSARRKALRCKLERQSEKIKARFPKTEKKERTKEAILELRREMMKPKAKVKEEKNEESYYEPDSLEEPAKEEGVHKNKSVAVTKSAQPSTRLLARLAEGGKSEITKKEMHKLTKKNYAQLPEVQEKVNEERRKKEVKERLKIAKELDKKRRLMWKRNKKGTN